MFPTNIFILLERRVCLYESDFLLWTAFYIICSESLKSFMLTIKNSYSSIVYLDFLKLTTRLAFCLPPFLDWDLASGTVMVNKQDSFFSLNISSTSTNVYCSCLMSSSSKLLSSSVLSCVVSVSSFWKTRLYKSRWPLLSKSSELSELNDSPKKVSVDLFKYFRE